MNYFSLTVKNISGKLKLANSYKGKISILYFLTLILIIPFLLLSCSENNASTGNNLGDSSVKVFPDDIILGSKDAKYTIVEYASLTCGHCANVQKNIMPEIKKKYIDTGIINIIYRDFPTPPANFSVAATLLSRCVYEKSGNEAYFAMLDMLYKSQEKWIFDKNPPYELRKIASLGGIRGEEFDNCIKNEKLKKELDARVKFGETNYGVNSTPSFFYGKNTLRVFQTQVFEEDLAKHIPEISKMIESDKVE